MSQKRPFYGPRIVAGGFLLFLVSGTFIFSFPVFLPALSQDMGWSRGDISIAQALSMLLLAIWGPVLGRLLRLVDARTMLIWGSLIATLAFVLLATITQIWQFYLYYGLILVLGMASMGFLPVNTIVSYWYVRRRSFALGIISAGIGAGGAIIAPLAQAIIDAYGWRQAYLALAAIVFLIAIPIATLVMKTRPEALGQLPDGELKISEAKGGNPASLQGFTFRQASRTRAFYFIGLGSILEFLAFTMAVSHFIARARDVGIPATTAAGALGLLALFSIAGRLGFGWLGDRIEKRFVLMTGVFCTFVGLIVLISLNSVPQLYLAAFLLALAVGGIGPLLPAILADYFGTRDFALLYGVLGQMAVGIGGSIGPPLAGYIFDFTGSYYPAFLTGVITSFIAIFVYFLAKRPRLQSSPS